MAGTIEAFDQDLVRRITRLSRRQLEYWDQINLISPSVAAHEVAGLPRLYSFRDLLKLKVAAEMRRRHVLPGEMKAKIVELEQRGITDPLLTLRIVGDPEAEGGRGRAFWIDPRSDAPMSWKDTNQPAAVYDLKMEDLRSGLQATIQQLTARSDGHVETVRGVQGSEPVIAGTRVPVRKIAALVKDGWGPDEVVAAMPHLTTKDVEAAISFEEERRRRRSA